MGEGSITLDPPQPPEGYCPGTEVTVTAVPDADWVFTLWGAGLPNLEWAPSQTFTSTPGPVDISAYFDYRPGISSLSMVEDLGAYLVAIGVCTDPEEVDAFDYDTGVEELDGLVTVHGPNGIPDAAELMALQAVMQNPAIGWKIGTATYIASIVGYQKFRRALPDADGHCGVLLPVGRGLDGLVVSGYIDGGGGPRGHGGVCHAFTLLN